MSVEEQSKIRNATSWITSIAISVLCCSILFVLFASYLVDLKADIRDDMMHINAVEERQNQILANIEAMSKRLPPPAAAAIAITAPATDATAPATPAAGTTTPAAAPAAAASDTETPPASVTVPVIPAAKP
jgi:hypothetical protein